MRTKTFLVKACVCLFASVLIGCGPTDVGQTSGTGKTVDQRISAVQSSAAPQFVKDRAIADIRSHAEAYTKSKK